MNNTPAPLAPAQLWLGNADALHKQCIAYLQSFFCKTACTGTCASCTAIVAQQHYGVTWLAPSTSYTVDDLAPLFSTLIYQLDEGQHHFFIISHADRLTPTCANSLLKSLEEPPPGYHFILLASQQDALLPTIISRCTIQTFGETGNTGTHPVVKLFTNAYPSSPLQFLKELETAKLHEHDTVALAEQIFCYYQQQYKKALLNNNARQCEQYEAILTLLKKALTTPPMPGSSTLFWKNLFLQMSA